jgi:hypothetical protein
MSDILKFEPRSSNDLGVAAARSGKKLYNFISFTKSHHPNNKMPTAPTTAGRALLFAGQGTDVTLTVNRLLKTDKADAARAYFARASEVSLQLETPQIHAVLTCP